MSDNVKHAVKNKYDAPDQELPVRYDGLANHPTSSQYIKLPEGPEVITRNAIALNNQNPDPSVSRHLQLGLMS